MNKIIILNGPNLNLLGERERNQYGNVTLEDIEKNCHNYAKKNKIKLSLYQSNIEGELGNKIQSSRNNQDGLIINAGGYTHTSVAIHDALRAYQGKIFELHISNPHLREAFRHVSFVAPAADAVIAGLGVAGYEHALESLLSALGEKT